MLSMNPTDCNRNKNEMVGPFFFILGFFWLVYIILQVDSKTQKLIAKDLKKKQETITKNMVRRVLSFFILSF